MRAAPSLNRGTSMRLTSCSMLLRASSTPPRYQPAAIHEHAHCVSKGQVSWPFKRRTMFPYKFLKPHWLVPRDFLDHLIGAGENTCRMILRDFKDMLCKEGVFVAPLQPPLAKCFKRYSFVGDFMS